MSRRRLGTDPFAPGSPAGSPPGPADPPPRPADPRRRPAPASGASGPASEDATSSTPRRRRGAAPAVPAAPRPRVPRGSKRPPAERRVEAAPTEAVAAVEVPAAAPEPLRAETGEGVGPRSLTGLEARFEEVLAELESRLASQEGLEAGTRRRLEEEIRLIGERLAERVDGFRTGGDRERDALALARALLTPDVLVKLAARRILSGRSIVVDAFGYDPVEASRLEGAVRFLVERWFRVEQTGVESIPDEGPALLVANHAGVIPFDGLVLSHLVARGHPRGRDTRWLVEDEAHHFPYFGTWMARLGAVRACPENARLLLERGAVLAVFPEGSQGLRKGFGERYRLRRFGRGGAVKLALRTGAPVIPVGVVGGEETYPLLGTTRWMADLLGVPFVPLTPLFPLLGPLGLLPLPVRWRVRFGAPIDLGLPPEAADDPAAVHRANERIRGEVQRLVSEILARRAAVFW